MLQPSEFTYDVSSGLVQGRRERQEDAVAIDFPVGSGHGFAVLADGMGGHDAGDVASRVVVTEIFSELKLQTVAPTVLEGRIRQTLCDATHEANLCIEHISRQNADEILMGATLLAPVLFDDRLYWISVGDSPLFLFRDGQLFRLNEIHSMAEQIDQMRYNGQIDADAAATHPDRHCLTSVLAGRDIPRIDCSDTPVQLRDGDIVVAASDGLEYLSEEQIADVIQANQEARSADISAALLREIERFDDPQQDNVSLCVIKLIRSSPAHSTQPVVNAGEHAAPENGSVTVLAHQSGGDIGLCCVSKKVLP